MNRTSRDNRDLPHPKPVERVELSEKHIKLRWTVTIALALLGIGLLTYSFMGYLGAEPGVADIEANLSQGMHLGEQFSFQYRLGQGEKSAAAEKKEITALYTEALIMAFRLFENIENEDSHNIYYINRHPNEAVTVDEMLYRAFEVYAASGTGNSIWGRSLNSIIIFSCVMRIGRLMILIPGRIPRWLMNSLSWPHMRGIRGKSG